MKIQTPLHADHQLDQLAGQFAHWRQTRTHLGERIPQPLMGAGRGVSRGFAALPRGQTVAVTRG